MPENGPSNLDLLGQQTLRVQELGLELADALMLLALATQAAWLDIWARPFLQTGAELEAWRERQDRALRLMRRGVPGPVAREGLHLLSN